MLQRGGIEITPDGEEQEAFWSALPEFAQRMPT
jgi:hypothetical protein